MPVFKNGHNAVLYRKMKQFLQKYKYILGLALILAIIAGIAVFSSISDKEDLSSRQSSAASQNSTFSDDTSLAEAEDTDETTALSKAETNTAQITVNAETTPSVSLPETDVTTQSDASSSQKPLETTAEVTTTESTKATASSAPQSSATSKTKTTLPESEPPKKYDYTCLFEIECRTVLDNIDKLSKDKKECIPDDGVFFSAETGFDKGETVYDILKRVCEENGIQLETEYTPAFATRYIEGIGNLYEFDCGTASGWMYTVNGEYMNYGCSSCVVSDGDKVAIRYTCELGGDLD